MSERGDDQPVERGERVVVREAGVEVTKSYEADRFPVPAIAFAIRSEREEPVGVRITEYVPEEIAMDDIGFHPEYGSDFWTLRDRTLVFEYELDTNEAAETVYGLRGPETEDPERFLDEPDLEVVAANEGTVAENTDESLTRNANTSASFDERDGATAAGGERADDDPANENEPTDDGAIDSESTDEERSTEDTTVSEDTTTETDGEASDDGPSDDEQGTTGPTPANEAVETGNGAVENKAGTEGSETDGAVARTLATELRTGQVGAEDRETLNDVLGPRDSVTARLEHLRAQVGDVTAYTDALESFIDENGSARQLVRRQTERTDAMREEVDTVSDRAAANREDIDSIENRLTAIGGDVTAFQDAIADLDESTEAMESRFEALDGRLNEIDERLDTLEDRSDTATNRLESVDERLASMDERLDSLEATHESELRELETRLKARIDEGLDEREDEAADLRGDISDLEDWRSQLSAVIGGSGANDSTGN